MNGWRVGARIDDLVLEGELGAGGMGSVYRARHVATGAALAVKVVATSADPELILRLQREGQMQARAQGHPNLARIHATGQAFGLSYLVVELLLGGSLEERLGRAGTLDPREAARIVRDLALGVAHAHACGVLHRDIKPANVLFDDEGRPKLIDFGLGRPVETGSGMSLTVSGALVGSPQYVSPEQAGAGTAGPLSDVYGLGGLLYRCLTGRPPHDGATVIAAVEQALTEDPPAARSLRPGLPRALDAICRRALARDPAARQGSAAALAEELTTFLTLPEQTPSPLRGLALLATGAIALAGAAVVVTVVRGRGRPAASEAPVASAAVAAPPSAAPIVAPDPAPIASAHLARAAKALETDGLEAVEAALAEWTAAAELVPAAPWPPELPGRLRAELNQGAMWGTLSEERWWTLGIAGQRMGLSNGILPHRQLHARKARAWLEERLRGRPDDWGTRLYLARVLVERTGEPPDLVLAEQHIAAVRADPRVTPAAKGSALAVLARSLATRREPLLSIDAWIEAARSGYGAPDEALFNAAMLIVFQNEPPRLCQVAEEAERACLERAARCAEGPAALMRGRPPGCPFDEPEPNRELSVLCARIRLTYVHGLVALEPPERVLARVREWYREAPEPFRTGLSEDRLIHQAFDGDGRRELVRVFSEDEVGALVIEAVRSGWARIVAEPAFPLSDRVHAMRSAAALGVRGMRTPLGDLLWDGSPGLPRDRARALELWRQAVEEEGDADARKRLEERAPDGR